MKLRKTVETVDLDTPVTHRNIRRLITRRILPGMMILTVTNAAGFVFAQRAFNSQTRESERSICAGNWQRYDGREGIRNVLFALELRFIPAGKAKDDFTDVVNASLAPYPQPNCPRPEDTNP